MQDGRDLAVVRQLTAAPGPNVNLAAATKPADVQARQIAEAAARRAVEELAVERERAALLARELDSARRERDAANRWAIQDGRDLVVARQLTAAPQPDANLAAAEKAAVMLARQIAEAAASRAVEELALEREKAASLARELDTARQERDAAKKQLTRISAAQPRASEEPRERTGARAPAAARKEIVPRKTRTERREAVIERAPKPLPDELLPRRLLPGLW
jgi:hypothetical protein